MLAQTEQLIVMEKVNGRAGACRFFWFRSGSSGRELYAVVGTKLAHVVCKVDLRNALFVLPAELNTADISASKSNTAATATTATTTTTTTTPDLDSSQSTSPTPATVVMTEFSRPLILSNIQALQSSLCWHRLLELVRWLQGRTLNGEVLDPAEMHLVPIYRHQWVCLCATQFPARESNPFDTGEDALEVMRRLSQFVEASSIPEYHAHSLLPTAAPASHTMTPTSGSPNLTISEKKQRFQDIVSEITFATNSEGKVLYFLDRGGAVLELLKYKTWWYIWRRSIREVTSRAFSRFYNISKEANDKRAVLLQHTAAEKAKLQHIIDQMSKAGEKAKTSVKFREKFASVQDQLNELERQEAAAVTTTTTEGGGGGTGSRAEVKTDGIDKRSCSFAQEIVAGQQDKAPDQQQQDQQQGPALYNMGPIVEDIIAEVRRKWPNKFAFLKTELSVTPPTTSTTALASDFVNTTTATTAAQATTAAAATTTSAFPGLLLEPVSAVSVSVLPISQSNSEMTPVSTVTSTLACGAHIDDGEALTAEGSSRTESGAEAAAEAATSVVKSMNSDGGERYCALVAAVIDMAVAFLQWAQQQFSLRQDSFYDDFRQRYPIVWEQFLHDTWRKDTF